MSRVDPDDPRCPECGEPIGATATYCMHCSADLTDEREAADADGDGYWDADESANEPDRSARADGPSTDEWQLLDPDGIVDDTLTALVGLGGGLVIGLIGTVVLAVLTESGWAVLVGALAWLAATVHLVRRRTVQDALARTAYGVAIVLLLLPLVAFAPVDGETPLGERVVVFAMMLGGLAVPAAVAAGIGFVASRFVPESGSEQ